MGLAKTVAPSLKSLPDRLCKSAALYLCISFTSFNTISSDTNVSLNLEYFRIEGKPNLKEGGGKLASKSSVFYKFFFLKMLAFFLSSKLVTLPFVLS